MTLEATIRYTWAGSPSERNHRQMFDSDEALIRWLADKLDDIVLVCGETMQLTSLDVQVRPTGDET